MPVLLLPANPVYRSAAEGDFGLTQFFRAKQNPPLPTRSGFLFLASS